MIEPTLRVIDLRPLWDALGFLILAAALLALHLRRPSRLLLAAAILACVATLHRVFVFGLALLEPYQQIRINQAVLDSIPLMLLHGLVGLSPLLASACLLAWALRLPARERKRVEPSDKVTP